MYIYTYFAVYICTVYEMERHEKHEVERKAGRREVQRR